MPEVSPAPIAFLVALTVVGLVCCVLVAAGCVWWQHQRRTAWQRAASGARWLGITPPAQVSAGSAEALWRLLAAQLPTDTWFTRRPARLVWEVHAAGEQLRVGVWVPAGHSLVAVRRAIDRAWPGARLTEARPPAAPRAVPEMRAVAGGWLGAIVPDGLPLLHPGLTDAAGSLRDRPARSEDPLRAVYGGLASAGRTGPALLQIVVGRAPFARVGAARRCAASRRHRRTLTDAALTGRAAASVAVAAAAALGLVLEILAPPRHRRREERQAWEPERVRAARVKAHGGPHLLTTVRVLTSGPTPEAAHAAAAEILAGFGLLSARLTRRPWPKHTTHAPARWVRLGERVLTTPAETAALAGLPADPALHGLAAAGARRRASSTGTWTPPRPPSGPPVGGRP
ncbi:hypothetical protein [Cryptosporangium sp. NPDC048952]|uniref:hypothetical protein n=1 Tax=Cryptosporangium sp. NPDC048952 TaxID=3363961 RepID=UPI003711B08F